VPGYSVDYSGLRSHRKNDKAPAPPPKFSFFMAPALASGRFHTTFH